MSKKKTKVLWCADLVAMTGFARVSGGILPRLRDDFEIVCMASNWWGDPCDEQSLYRMYPASNRHQTAPFGEQRIREIVENDPSESMAISAETLTAIPSPGLVFWNV